MLSSFVLPAVCPSMATLNETSGALTSPYYPRSYPSSRSCSWKITASKGQRIVLVIKDIYISGTVDHLARATTCRYKMDYPLMASQAGEDVETIKTVG